MNLNCFHMHLACIQGASALAKDVAMYDDMQISATNLQLNATTKVPLCVPWNVTIWYHIVLDDIWWNI
jgi:hypothetical protein